MNKLHRHLLAVLLTVAIAAQANAQQQQQSLGTLTLQECIQIAQDQSPIAEAARYALIAGRWEYRSFQAGLLPSLSFSGNAPNYNKSFRTDLQPDGSTRYIYQTQSDANARLFINQNLMMTGGRLSVSTELARLGIFQNENSYFWQSTPVVIGYQQPLFQFNSLKWQNRIEPLRYEISQKEYVEEMEEIAVTVARQFFDVYLAKINLENAKFNVVRNDSIYNISRGRYNVGSIAENDLLQSELQLRNAEAALTRAQIEFDRSLNNFKILLGYPTDVELDLSQPEVLPEINVDIEKAKQLAIQNNSEALTYELQELQADRDYAQAKSQSTFNATINANIGFNQTSVDFIDLYDKPQNRQFFSVSFDIPIFNWGKQQAEINAARNQQRQVANSIEFQRRQFNQEVEYTVSQFLQLRDQVLLAAQSDTIAQRRYEVAQNRYLIGKIDVTNLFIAQNEKDAARQEYIRALREYWVGWYNLRRLTLFNFRENKPISYQLEQ